MAFVAEYGAFGYAVMYLASETAMVKPSYWLTVHHNRKIELPSPM